MTLWESIIKRSLNSLNISWQSCRAVFNDLLCTGPDAVDQLPAGGGLMDKHARYGVHIVVDP